IDAALPELAAVPELGALRSLRLSGRAGPEALRELGRSSSLARLSRLEFGDFVAHSSLAVLGETALGMRLAALSLPVEGGDLRGLSGVLGAGGLRGVGSLEVVCRDGAHIDLSLLPPILRDNGELLVRNVEGPRPTVAGVGLALHWNRLRRLSLRGCTLFDG